ncbi:MAG TPA: D-alanine--D-serine ligase VanG [Anaerovoracaceae bacterium]|nr:D-alanine--D-serine ligase VanG [Anaerovoracaceae bacterium]
MKKKRIAVVFGGCSSEYVVSLQSSYSVITNLDPAKYETIMIGITKDGDWYLFEGDADKIPADTWAEDSSCKEAVISPSRKHKGILVLDEDGKWQTLTVDMVFPVLHGKNGEDGTIQGLLELAGIPIIGCGMGASYICMDKDVGHKLAAEVGVRVPKARVASKWDNPAEYMSQVKALGFPLFVKPVKAGSSFGITKVHDESELPGAIKEAFKYDAEIIFEENIEGFEVGCAVFGNDKPFVSGVDEIELFVDWFDYEEKYTQEKSKIHFPARIDDEIAERIRDYAGKIYRALQCRGFARVDLFLTPENDIVFNEINTIPGLTTHSRYPKMVNGMGISYPELLDKLVEYAEEE